MSLPVLDELLGDVAHLVFDDVEYESEEGGRIDTIPCPPPGFDVDLDHDGLDHDDQDDDPID